MSRRRRCRAIRPPRRMREASGDAEGQAGKLSSEMRRLSPASAGVRTPNFVVIGPNLSALAHEMSTMFDQDQTTLGPIPPTMWSTVELAMRHAWDCYTTRCCNCGRSGLLQVWSEAKGWDFRAHGLSVAAVSRRNPVNSIMRCLSCNSSVIDFVHQRGSRNCSSTICPFGLKVSGRPPRCAPTLAAMSCPNYGPAIEGQSARGVRCSG